MNPVSRRQFVGLLAAGASVGVPEPEAASSIKNHGAVGDGVADDTAAIQRAVDARAGVVYFPKGAYRLTRTVLMDLDTRGYTSLVGHGVARVIMAGAGPAFHVIGTHEGTADPRRFDDRIWDRQRLPIITGLEIRGEHPESIGIRLEKTMQATLTNLLIRRCRIGLHLHQRHSNPARCNIYRPSKR